jgi:hypothetical protein
MRNRVSAGLGVGVQGRSGPTSASGRFTPVLRASSNRAQHLPQMDTLPLPARHDGVRCGPHRRSPWRAASAKTRLLANISRFCR